MNDGLKIALILAVTAVLCVGLYLYFSPYQSCVRGVAAEGKISSPPSAFCANALGGGFK